MNHRIKTFLISAHLMSVGKRNITENENITVPSVGSAQCHQLKRFVQSALS
jgi:hypothetical protein